MPRTGGVLLYNKQIDLQFKRLPGKGSRHGAAVTEGLMRQIRKKSAAQSEDTVMLSIA